MAAGGQKVVACSLVDIGSLRLENTDIHPFGIFVHKDILVITDYDEWNVQLYRRRDGKLLAISDKLDSQPFSVCFINDKEICVTMRDGTIQIMSVGDMGVITRVRQLRINKVFESCQGIVRLKENFAICGINRGTIYWCIVSLNNEPIGSIHRICKGRLSHLTTKDNNIYISCDNCHDDSSESGVYGYDIDNPGKHAVLYKHEDLEFPKGITVDSAGYLFVCNFFPPCIHHLTDQCELLTIYRNRIPVRQLLNIFWDNGIMYATSVMGMEHCWENLVTRYKPKYSYEEGDHKVPELTDELRQSFIEEAPTEQETGLQRRFRITYGDGEVVYLKPGEFPSIVKCIEIREPSVLQTGTFASTQEEKHTTSRKGVSCSDPKTLCQVLNKATQDASSSRSTLEENCLTVGLKIQGETPGNGNCFFEAVSSQLHRLNCSLQKSPQQLRRDVVIFIKTNRVLKVSEGTIDLAEYVDSETFEHYCIRMAKDGEWADHVAVVGMARMLRSDIMIVTSLPSAGPDDSIVWVVGEQNFQGIPILLGHIWEHHYESLEPIGDNKTPEVEVIYQRIQHGSEDPQTKTEQHVIEDLHTRKKHHVSEDPRSHIEQLVSEDPYVQEGQNVIEDPYTKIEQRVHNIDSVEETCLTTSNQTVHEEYQKSLQERALPPGKKYHVFFSYASPDIQWVKKIVKKLEKDHGFVCCEYDRDNTPGTPLMTFADDSIRNAYKTVVVMTREAFQSGFVLLEIQMALNHGFIEKRNCIVPVLVEDCEIPGYLRVLNYVDARDTNRSNIWWPKLLMELEYEGD